jgi:hypothetical protein
VVTAAFSMPKAQIGMAGGKYRSNTYDDDLVKRHEVNSAINNSSPPPDSKPSAEKLQAFLPGASNHQ